MFHRVNDDGTVSAIPSDEYNHQLATWAMELSYKAYNPLVGFLAPAIPGGFMNGKTERAMDVLMNYGFNEDIIANYNYGSNDTIAYTIAYKNIEIHNYNSTEINNLLGENINANNVVNLDNFSSSWISGGTSNQFSGGDTAIIPLTEAEDSTNINIATRSLVVIDVRGSETWVDWVTNLATQFHMGCFTQFSDGKEMILRSLFTGTGNTEECTNEDCVDGCAFCEGYITHYSSNNQLQNPMILVILMPDSHNLVAKLCLKT